MIRCEFLASNLDSLFLQVWPCIQEGLGDNDRGTTTVRGRAALQLSERLVDLGGVLDLFEGVFVLELGVGVALGVLVVDACDFGKVLGLSSVSFLSAMATMMLGIHTSPYIPDQRCQTSAPHPGRS